jgi:hypothetical protein
VDAALEFVEPADGADGENQQSNVAGQGHERESQAPTDCLRRMAQQDGRGDIDRRRNEDDGDDYEQVKAGLWHEGRFPAWQQVRINVIYTILSVKHRLQGDRDLLQVLCLYGLV